MKTYPLTLVMAVIALGIGFPGTFTDIRYTEAAATTVPTVSAITPSTSSIEVATLTQAFERYAVPKTAKVSYMPVPAGKDVGLILAAIAQCESENNPKAKNPNSSAKGLLQIIDGTWTSFACQGNVYDPEDNMRCGLRIATMSGLHHWNESKQCWIKKVSDPLALK